MKRSVLFLALVALMFLCSCSSSKKTANAPKMYQVQTMGVGVDGTYLIKVSDYFRTTDESVYLDKLKEDAVNCVIYNGIPAGNGSLQQPALINGDTFIEGKEAEMNAFFEQKKYLMFIHSVVNSSKEIVRLKGSKDYKISVTISVKKDELRKYLIDNGIIKSLDFIF